jgi:ribosomal protein S27AE
MEAAKEKIDVYFRTMIYNFANNTAAQPLPEAVRVLHTFNAKTFDEVLKVESDFVQTKVVKLPTKRHKLAATIQDDIIKKSDDTTVKRLQIGFKKTDDTTAKADETGVHNESRSKPILTDDTKTILVNNSDFGKCENCGNSFFRNHKIHRFCCEDCRKTAWSNKTGKTLDLSIKSKERRKK